MENELKNPSKNFPSEKFVLSEFLAEWKKALTIINISCQKFLSNECREIYILYQFSIYLKP